MENKPSYNDLVSKIVDLESKLENLENNQNKLKILGLDQKETLHQREQEFRSMVENAPDIIYRFDKAFKHTYVNAAVEKATGISKQDFIGKDHRELGMPEDIVLLFQKNIRQVFETGKETEFSFMFPTPTGEHYYEARYVPEFATSGTVESVMGVTRDVTERKRATIALTQREIQLKELNATKDKFFSIIAHDLKSPFNSIIGFSDLLLKNHKKYDSQKLEKLIQPINSTAKSTFKLLENLLDWSMSQTGKLDFEPKEILIADIVANMLAQKEASLKHKEINLEFELHDIEIVFADEYMLNTIFRNLISNAIKFTNRNGNIKITAINTSDNCVFSFWDTGIGISKQDQEKIFILNEKSSTEGTENEKGTGLGLILCKEFIANHNGEIWVESEIGKGTKFSFSIPLEVKG